MTITAILSMSVTIFFVLAGFVKKNSVFLFILQAVWMWILLAGNTNSIDYGVNSQIYEVAQDDAGLSYQSIMYWFGSQGYDFFTFNAVEATFVLLLFYLLVYRISKNPCFVLSLVFIFPFVDFVIQKRFFIASVFGMLFLYFYTHGREIYRKIIAILFFLLGISIHEGIALFALFLLYPLFLRTRHKKAYVVFFLIIFSAMLPALPKLTALLPIIGADRAELYFEILHEKIKYPMLTTAVYTLMHGGFVWLYYKLYRKNLSLGRESLLGKEVLYLDLLSLMILPAYYWEPTFFRLFRTLLPFNYIALSNMMPLGQVYNKNVLFQGIRYIIFASIIFLGYYFVLSAGFGVVAQPVFEDNILFE